MSAAAAATRNQEINNAQIQPAPKIAAPDSTWKVLTSKNYEGESRSNLKTGLAFGSVLLLLGGLGVAITGGIELCDDKILSLYGSSDGAWAAVGAGAGTFAITLGTGLAVRFHGLSGARLSYRAAVADYVAAVQELHNAADAHARALVRSSDKTSLNSLQGIYDGLVGAHEKINKPEAKGTERAYNAALNNALDARAKADKAHKHLQTLLATAKAKEADKAGPAAKPTAAAAAADKSKGAGGGGQDEANDSEL